ncbi:unnamed protein product [Paramecium pentaurelia]|uniref:mRNA m(6)A methyltransferase n=1 Tax=Paramecium pentaurelia TaxID=43138 RepID=A0A8S1VLA2_9CILI|nr:unnamed protein product [Paramecium pentaurelia]
MQGRRSQQSKSTAEDNLDCNGKQVISLDKVINTNEDQKQQKTKKQQKEVSTKKQNSTNTEELSGVSIKESQNGTYNLRQYTRRNYLDFGSEAGGDDNNDIDFGVKKQLNKERKNSDLDINETIEYDKLPKNKQGLIKLLSKVEASIESQKLEWFKEQNELPTLTSSVPENSIPINADVITFNFKSLIASQQKIAGKLFDAIMMDPPWQLSTSQPSRGVAIAYQSLKDDQLMELPIPLLQKEGFLFIWTINAKYRIAAKMMKQWGYQLVDELIWVKKTVNGKIAKGHGFYLQHAKENCLIGYKGNNKLNYYLKSDVIWSERRGQSQKPEEIYEIINAMVPGGHCLEIFGRRNNLRNNWVTIGNEL